MKLEWLVGFMFGAICQRESVRTVRTVVQLLTADVKYGPIE